MTGSGAMASTRASTLVATAIVLALAFVLAAPAPAEAQCTVYVQSGVAFGTYDVFSGVPVDAVGRIAYMCGNKDKDIRISLTRGSGSTYLPRRMTGEGDVLDYNLFRDAACTQIWGDLSEGTSVYSIHNPPNNRWVELTVYGRIPPGQDRAAGTYGDTVVVEINF